MASEVEYGVNAENERLECAHLMSVLFWGGGSSVWI